MHQILVWNTVQSPVVEMPPPAKGDAAGACLVARSVGNRSIDAEKSLLEAMNKLNLAKEEQKAPKSDDKPQMMEKTQSKTEFTSPGEFFQIHRLRTSALARKTKTTSNFGGRNPDLFQQLQQLSLSGKRGKPEELGNDKDETEEKENAGEGPEKEKIAGKGDEEEEEDDDDEDLIGRTPGPVQPERHRTSMHPYYQPKIGQPLQPQQQQEIGCYNSQQYLSPLFRQRKKSWSKNQYCLNQMYENNSCDSAQIGDGSGYSDYQYEQVQYVSDSSLLSAQDPFAEVYGSQPLSDPCLATANGSFSPCSGRDESTPPCTMLAQGPYGSLDPIPVPSSPFTDSYVTNDELNRLLDVPTELPEDLSDFILKYSRRYSADTPPGDSRSTSRKSSSSDSSNSSSPKHTPHLSDDGSGCDSPMSAGSAPQSSPAAPKGGQTPGTPNSQKQVLNGQSKRFKPILPKQQLSSRKAKARDRLRALFSDMDHDMAWVWALKCVQSCPGALYFRDPDGDSLLHIVVWHKDLGKIYALIELMLKTEYAPCQKPFDLPNRLHETPLFLAVEKRMEEVVSYLVECGANPNFQTRKVESDAALHHAAARGMAEIVQALCASPSTDKNLRNGLGLTPLLCAVRNHGVIEEESQCLVNNKPTIRALLKAGADPKIPDAQCGKTVLHYSVERMDPELVEIYRDNLDKEEMHQLVNIASYDGETPIQMLARMGSGQRSGTGLGRLEAEDELRRKMFLTLINCGAELPSRDDPIPLLPESPFPCLDG